MTNAKYLDVIIGNFIPLENLRKRYSSEDIEVQRLGRGFSRVKIKNVKQTYIMDCVDWYLMPEKAQFEHFWQGFIDG